MHSGLRFPALFIALLVPACLLAGGCASVSVTGEQRLTADVGVNRPAQVYVMPFATDDGEFYLDKEGEELEQTMQALSELLADEIARRSTEHVAPAEVLFATDELPETGWLVRGRFTRLDQGSRALRAFVGLGAGRSMMETHVEVLDLAMEDETVFLSFATTGGSNAEPGAILSGPFSAAPAAARGAYRGVSDDLRRTSRVIVANMNDYLFKQGWIDSRDRLAVKRERQRSRIRR